MPIDRKQAHELEKGVGFDFNSEIKILLID